jgi:hypothetical protein
METRLMEMQKTIPTIPTIHVVQVKGGRITGWVIRCTECGEAKVAFRTKEAARAQAGIHSSQAHGGKAITSERRPKH